jgi:flagellin-like hook-associated protein FlgL
VFVQVTFDGALVDAADEDATTAILGSSHIHSINSTILLSDRFEELHPGLYHVDVELPGEGTYIIHAVAFYRGFLSHDSRIIDVSASSIGTIQESLDRLNAELDSTNHELGQVQERLAETQSALGDTKETITNLVEDASTSIRRDIDLAQEASGQINSLILPVLVLISVIIALQISLFARIRASYR